MIEPFLCYIFNAYPELPTICENLNGVALHILEGRPIDSLTRDIEESLSDIEEFLLTRDGRFLPSTFRKIELRRMRPLRL